MADTLKPRDGKEVEDVVRWALDNDKPLELAGNGTKYGIGRPSQTDLTLDLSGLAGVTLYEPAELVLSARAGTPISEIEVLLDKHNQELAFEPIDYGPLLGAEANNGTLGGVDRGQSFGSAAHKIRRCPRSLPGSSLRSPAAAKRSSPVVAS